MPGPPSTTMSPPSRCYRCCSSPSTPPPPPQQPIRGARLLLTRRAHALSLLAGAASVASVAVAGRARAAAEEDGKGEGVVGAFKSLFDPNEETKAGKVLPKAYLKAAREVVRTLRESLEEGDAAGDSARFRRSRMLRWRRPSNRWRSSTPRQDPLPRFREMSKARSSTTLTPRRPTSRSSCLAALYFPV
uniref:Predicted protein n=1 Tax=Hordeum vulgare subsp. vulgare TaxID=112509 RepID=F2E2M3_HORVV|nr:predicted protein [Hordeum vulgare subsp. vulgare]